MATVYVMSYKPEQQSDKNKDKSSKDVRELIPKQTHPSTSLRSLESVGGLELDYGDIHY